MGDAIRVTGQINAAGLEMSIETGKLAKQADGAVVVRSGDTMVLATAVGRAEAREGADFFPLTIDVEERMYAAGKIPGGFFKREGRASERATLTARMIDRPIRPLWPKGFRNEVQVICTVLSADLVVPHDILCINGASAALQLSPQRTTTAPSACFAICPVSNVMSRPPISTEVDVGRSVAIAMCGSSTFGRWEWRFESTAARAEARSNFHPR
jgi:polyribonucleotide nucleotidyltransferase